MRQFWIALCIAVSGTQAAYAAAVVEDAEDWAMISRILALVQPIVHLAAHSPDPQAAQKAMEAILAGRDPHANRIASDLLEGALAEVPPEHRPLVRSLGRDVFVLAQRQQARAEGIDHAIRARKELHAMGLRYWDEQQFREAQARGDSIAVELFLAARGVRNPPAAR
jgi:hypothetical protein